MSKELGAPCLDFEKWETTTLNRLVSAHNPGCAARAKGAEFVSPALQRGDV